MACSVPVHSVDSSSPNGQVSTGRPIRFKMEGVGARVIRGPDWKWGKQVSVVIENECIFCLNRCFLLC